MPSGPDSVEDYWVNDQFRSSSLYTTDEFAKDFTEMLDGRQQSGDTDPFFAYLAFNAPHAPFEAPNNAFLEEFENIQDESRKTVLAMIYRMDIMVGAILTR